MLLWSRDSISLSFLVDSGADDSFIDQDLVKQASILREVLSEPKTILGLNGEILVKVTNRTAPLTLIVSGNHSEQIQFFLIHASISTDILETSWLALHNPQVQIRQGDQWETAFNTCLGHFEYLVMPFGFTNPPAVFQAFVIDVLCDMLNEFLFVYLNDILIFETKDEHVQHIRLVLQRLLENKLDHIHRSSL